MNDKNAFCGQRSYQLLETSVAQRDVLSYLVDNGILTIDTRYDVRDLANDDEQVDINL